LLLIPWSYDLIKENDQMNLSMSERAKRFAEQTKPDQPYAAYLTTLAEGIDYGFAAAKATKQIADRLQHDVECLLAELDKELQK
jgi:membrane-anchored protein YejM (alkaline phosphatase superfamily)